MAGFKRAQKSQSFLRLALYGTSGSGKSMTALKIGAGLGSKVAAIDSERGSLSLYSDIAEFDVIELESFSPLTYINWINEAAKEGYDVLIIDSLSAAWSGADGALEMVDKVAKRNNSGGNKFTAWSEVTPIQNKLIDTILKYPGHVLVTLRSKTEFVLETNEKGKTVPRKVGMAPIQRDNLEYEFSVTGRMEKGDLVIEKTRCPVLDNEVFHHPGADVADILKSWLDDGVPAKPRIDRDLVLTQTAELMSQLGWQAKDGMAHLKATYGKQSRQLLTDDELVEFADYLAGLRVTAIGKQEVFLGAEQTEAVEVTA